MNYEIQQEPDIDQKISYVHSRFVNFYKQNYLTENLKYDVTVLPFDF